MSPILFETTNEICVCDTETLGRWDNSIILSVAFCHGDLSKPYTVEELIEERGFFMKFDVKSQVEELERKSCVQTIEWWKSDKVTEKAREVSFYPSFADHHVSKFEGFYLRWAHLMGFEPNQTIHMDRNLFDLRKLQHAQEISLGYGSTPWNYHNIEDITTRLKAYTGDRYGGLDIRKLEGVTYHDPRYDAAVDWLRLRNAALLLNLFD